VTRPIIALSIAVVAACQARAATFTFATPPHATESSGLAVNTKAIVWTGANEITLELENLEANPLSDAQSLSGFFFTLPDTPTGLPGTTIPADIANVIQIASGGIVTRDTSSALQDWKVTVSGRQIHIDSLPGSPKQTIIGPGPYTAANPSVTVGPHNPYIDQIATFTFNANGVTANTIVTNGTFAFGTAEGNNVAGVSEPVAAAPEPSAKVLTLGGLGLLALVAAGLRRRPFWSGSSAPS
jgi:MYXO-CTERM domain-containing protein